MTRAPAAYNAVGILVQRMRSMPLASNSIVQRMRNVLLPTRIVGLKGVQAELYNKDMVCFLGEAKSGKTVSSTLLKHATFNYFAPLYEDMYVPIVSPGLESVNSRLGDMMIHGQFPASTHTPSHSGAVLNVYKISDRNTGIYEIIMPDSFAEQFFNYLVNECDDDTERHRKLLEHESESNGVGPLSYYIFARMYILTIDCSDLIALEQKQYLLANAITTLHKVHSAVGLTRNKKINSGIAILFTKVDLLSDRDSLQSPTNLLNRMPVLKSALDALHGGALECFKVSISTCAESDDDRDKRVIHEREIYKKECIEYTRRKEAAKDKFSGISAQERKQAGNDLRVSYHEFHMSMYDENLRKLECPPPALGDFDEEEVRKAQTRRPTTPLKYSHNEYVELVTWIVSRLVGYR